MRARDKQQNVIEVTDTHIRRKYLREREREREKESKREKDVYILQRIWFVVVYMKGDSWIPMTSISNQRDF